MRGIANRSSGRLGTGHSRRGDRELPRRRSNPVAVRLASAEDCTQQIETKENFERIKFESGHGLSPEIKEAAKRQVRYGVIRVALRMVWACRLSPQPRSVVTSDLTMQKSLNCPMLPLEIEERASVRNSDHGS